MFYNIVKCPSGVMDDTCIIILDENVDFDEASKFKHELQHLYPHEEFYIITLH